MDNDGFLVELKRKICARMKLRVVSNDNEYLRYGYHEVLLIAHRAETKAIEYE